MHWQTLKWSHDENYYIEKIDMKRKLFLIASGILLSLAQAQQVPGLSSPKSIYENIERISIKREIPASDKPVTLLFSEAPEYLRKLADEHVNAPGNVALMLIEKGKIIYEGYTKNSNQNRRFISMSMAKSLTSLAIGEALCSGKIASLDDSVEKYATELKGLAIGRAKIVDLLKMNSGVKTTSIYHGNPYAKSGDDLLFQRIGSLALIKKYDNSEYQGVFGNTWNYSNLDTDALNYVVRGATGMSLGEWYAETVALKAGLGDKSYWGLDADQVEVAPSHYYATVRDWGRIALYLRDAHKSNRGDCMSNYILQATKRQIQARSPEFKSYGYQFWTANTTTMEDDFWMVGYAGQRIGLNIKEDKIILNFSWMPDPERTYVFFRNWIKRD